MVEAVKRGETKISGSYELMANGEVKIEQKNFMFKNKNGELRVGRFKNGNEVLRFFETAICMREILGGENKVEE